MPIIESREPPSSSTVADAANDPSFRPEGLSEGGIGTREASRSEPASPPRIPRAGASSAAWSPYEVWLTRVSPFSSPDSPVIT